jgi:hypothetical protein
MVSDQGCENDADSQQFMEADIPADCAGSGWRSGRAKSHSAQKKSYRNCELAHRRRPSCLFICRQMAPRAHALHCASGAFAFRNYWVIAMGVFHRTAMLCSWFIESTMSGCTERFRVR